MTKEERDSQIEEVKKLLGEPDFDYDQTPLNESAKKIKEIRGAFKSERMKAQWEEKKKVEEHFSKEDLKQAASLPAKPIYIADHDLKGFSELERAIIEAYYEDRNLNQQELSKRFGLPRQTITKLFHSTQFNALRIKYYEYTMPSKLMLATEKLVDAGHEKTILRLNEHYGIIKAEKTDINITSKPIEDPEAIKILRELGDKLSGEKKED